MTQGGFVSECNGKALYPPINSAFARGDFGPLIPVVIGALTIALLITLAVAFIARYLSYKKRSYSLLEYGFIFYFSISALIHTNLERYYAHHTEEIYDHTQHHHLMARMWRYYGVSDTRWLGQQDGVPRSQYSCMYGLEVMAAWGCGPGVILTLILYAIGSRSRWIVQVIAVVIQAYGLLITWIPPVYEHNQSIPECHPFLYWGLYLGIQSPWLFVPILVCIHSIIKVNNLPRHKAHLCPRCKDKSSDKGDGPSQLDGSSGGHVHQSESVSSVEKDK